MVPVDQILIVITLHFILNGRLEVANPLEGQLEVRLQALVGRLQAFNVHFLVNTGPRERARASQCDLKQQRSESSRYQLVFFAAGLRLLLSQLAHLFLDVADLPLEPLVLLLLPVLAAAALVSLLRQLLQVLLDAGHEALHVVGVGG